ncbi:MAG TPA: DUF5678 domain-containing protein [Blastocatellia bacterium]|nr:DUF5678 domain-containing protein [Blastocatellia bacterium]HMV82516.1 DUF5678 domain-containing protein [Blastocatellia bacterium]HMX24670.1 DUF5678 domain-containing protein [Blastocatellia bacterium]HMY73068.1 DUF5678 domain-containing protein [Blastocatellia bacterium]HMZ18914.1 DUF5678 domain-containing protein [Blastocatellia bacterium]
MAAAAVEKVVSEFEQLSPEQQREALRLLRQKLNGSAPHEAVTRPKRLNERAREYAWLEEHRAEYLDQWVALDGDRLLSHGPTLAHVRREAEAQGVEDALMILIETAEGPEFQKRGKGDRIVAVNVPMPDRSREHEWLKQHEHEYAGQWLALDDGRLISHGHSMKEVAAEAKKLGFPNPYFVHAESPDDLPWAGF